MRSLSSKKQAIMLDDHLLSLELEGWEASIATGEGRTTLKLLHGTYHEKFKGMKIGQAWLVKGEDGLYLKAVFPGLLGCRFKRGCCSR
jgi:putative transposase